MPRRKATAEEQQAIFDPYAALDQQLDSAEKKFNLTAMAVDKHEPRFSTGLLSLDVVLSGGLLGGGWYTCYGGEQSCKSTLAMTILSSIMIQKDFKGRSAYFDYEGSSQGDYIENIMRYMGLNEKVENVFGLRDEDTGQWLIQPRVRYYQPDTGEEFFNYLSFLEKSLPDKVRIGKKDWFYIYPNTRDNQRMLKGKYDTQYFKTHNKFKVPADDGSIQSIILCDSYPAMLPKQSEDKEEGDKSIGLQARMFAEGLRRVKGKMRRKRIVVVGVNQLRDKPMVMYGCFQHDSRVMLADGSTESIGNIVEEKRQVEVMSYNRQTDTFEPKPVVNWFNNGQSEQFLKVSLQTADNDEREIHVTPNHKMLRFKATEMEPMSNFEIGDALSSISHYELCGGMACNKVLNEDQTQIILASALTTGFRTTKDLAEQHVFQLDIRDQEFIRGLTMCMKYFLYKEGSGNVDYSGADNQNNGQGTATHVTYLMFDPLFDLIGSSMADTSNVVMDDLVPLLTIQGLSLMYQFEGRYVEKMDKVVGPVIPCKRFNEENIQLLMAHLKKITGLTWSNSEEHQGLVVDQDDVQAAMELIAKYSLGSRRIPSDFTLAAFEKGTMHVVSGRPAGKRHANTPAIITDIEVVTEPTDETPVNFDKYDIEVEGNHTYIVDGCIVHNSPEQEPGGNALKFYCHDGNTLLQTQEGLLYPDELLAEEPGCSVVGVNGPETPTVYKSMGAAKTLALTTGLGYIVGGKPDHRVMTVSKGSAKIGWSTLEEIKDNPEDVFVAVKSTDYFPERVPLLPELVPSDWVSDGGVDLAYLMGVLVHCSPVNDVLTLYARDKSKAKIKELADTFGVEYMTRDLDNVITFNVNSGGITRMLNLGLEFGVKAVVPWFIRRSRKDAVASFLSGTLMSSYSNANNRYSNIFNSVNLAKEVQILLSNFGVLVNRFEARMLHVLSFSRKALQIALGTEEQPYKLLDPVSVKEAESLISITVSPETPSVSDLDITVNDSPLYDLSDPLDPYDVIPPVIMERLSSYCDEQAIAQVFQTQAEHKSTLLSALTPDFFTTLEEATKLLPPVEREAAQEELKALLEFTVKTARQGISWQPVRSIMESPETQIYDGNMPETSTIVTSGIVSHNSDVRFRASSVAIPHAKGYEELEESVVYDGEDKYRYIKLRTHKNKLGGIPNQSLHVRLVIEDANGNAKGFCRTWDAYQYLKLTGQIGGTRKKIKFLEGVDWHDQDLKEHYTDFKNPLAGQTLAWIDFKCLIEGHKRDIADLCKNLGLQRPIIMRNWLAKQCASGQGYELLKINKRVLNAKTKAKAGAVADDDDD